MEKYRFLLSGSGGQGVITMAILLAEAAVLYEGLTAVQSQAYGPEARGGATRSDVIVSDGPIYFPKVTQPNILVALNQASFIKYQSAIRPGGILITDSHLVNVAGKLDVRHVISSVCQNLNKPKLPKYLDRPLHGSDLMAGTGSNSLGRVGQPVIQHEDAVVLQRHEIHFQQEIGIQKPVLHTFQNYHGFAVVKIFFQL